MQAITQQALPQHIRSRDDLFQFVTAESGLEKGKASPGLEDVHALLNEHVHQVAGRNLVRKGKG
ncbi:hypothetical protein FQZ97_1099400 [compost metagenome]